ncbi:hypothetical protein C8Q80DRAFT_1118269 [Daedaleopsis nitida]|nr:hypothetical protein C8Q80DRAFT_1118269 [Daedaleopsis nitida]
MPDLQPMVKKACKKGHIVDFKTCSSSGRSSGGATTAQRSMSSIVLGRQMQNLGYSSQALTWQHDIAEATGVQPSPPQVQMMTSVHQEGPEQQAQRWQHKEGKDQCKGIAVWQGLQTCGESNPRLLVPPTTLLSMLMISLMTKLPMTQKKTTPRMTLRTNTKEVKMEDDSDGQGDEVMVGTATDVQDLDAEGDETMTKTTGQKIVVLLELLININTRRVPDVPTEKEYKRAALLDPEATAVNNIEEEDGTNNGDCPFIVHGLTGSTLEHLGGKVLGIGQEKEPESLYNNPQLYSQMFP